MGSSKVFEHGYQIEQFVIVSIREPAADRNGVLWVEDVGSGRVVDDDGFSKISSDLRQILCFIRISLLDRVREKMSTYLDVIALMVIATLTEQAMVNHAMNVQLIEQWIAILERVSGRRW